MDKNLLFIYMVRDTGHQKAAEAMMAAASQIDPKIKCVGMDAASHAYPFISHFFNRVYLELLKRAPQVWDFLYDNPKVESITREARSFLSLFSSFQTQKILGRTHPKAVVCTQAVPATALANEKKRGRLKVPLIGVITDFGVHRYWVHPEIDLYLVAHSRIKKKLRALGIPSHRIFVTGIPIHPQFGETKDREKIRKRLKLKPRLKTLLLMGGGRGLGNLEDILLKLPVKNRYQTIVICGHNRRLYHRLLKNFASFKRIHIFGYVKNISDLMHVSDLLITKPGGISCSEALAMRLPMILINPIPGQEVRNVGFLKRKGVALYAKRLEAIEKMVSKLFSKPQRLAVMKEKSGQLSRPHSSWESAQHILDFIEAEETRAHG